MPDWTYHPLRPVAATFLGERRTQLWALRFLAALITFAGGRRWIPWVFDHPEPVPDWCGRFGASVPPSVAAEAVVVLPVQGASIVEIDPVRRRDVELVRRAAAGRRCRVTAVADDAETAALLCGHVDQTSVGVPTGDRLETPDLDVALTALATPGRTVLATPDVLIAAGPGWFNRVIRFSSSWRIRHLSAITVRIPPSRMRTYNINSQRGR